MYNSVTAVAQDKAFVPMHEIDDILSRSISKEEVVVSYLDAMELLSIYLDLKESVLGWEGWIKTADGCVGHFTRYQGTSDLSSISTSAAIALIKSSIMQSYKDWKESPEVDNDELYFCITTR